MRRPAGRLALYAAGIEAATWAGLVPAALWQQAHGFQTADALAERLGRRRPRRAQGLRVVVHAVSLGELAAARGLLAALSPKLPDARVTLTVGTADARAVADRLVGRGQVDGVQYLPWDRPRVMRAWLSTLDPALVVVLETELWPGLLDECRRRDVPVALVSGRVYPADVARYRLIRGFLAPLLETVALVAAQSAEERMRLLAIGAPAGRTIVTGDLKAVAALDAPSTSLRHAGLLDEAHPLVVAGCTHHPEEHWLLDAFQAVRLLRPELRLAIAPRAIDRAGWVARRAAARGFAVATTSAARGNRWDVLVADEPGVLGGLYRHAAMAVIGGSFAPRGGHSLFEAAAAGVPVVCGPETTHVASQVTRFAAAGALVRTERGALADAMISLLADPGRAHAMGAAARVVVSTLASEAAEVAGHLPGLLRERSRAQANERVAV